MTRLAFILIAALSTIFIVDAVTRGVEPAKIALEAGLLQQGKLTLNGPVASRQIVLNGQNPDGSVMDVTRTATYMATPANLVRVEPTGLIIPLRDGTVQITATVGKTTTAFAVEIKQIANELPVSFNRDVVPLFTKLGCNGGSCHGKSGGQNGFALSLFGFEPAEDFDALVKESKGRRLFPAAPESSLLLRKATGQMSHAGGKRLEIGSPAHNLLLRWMRQGTPPSPNTEPAISRIEVLPVERLLLRGKDQQLTVLAHRTDGSVVDVTRLTRFDSNDIDLADVSTTGLVTAKNRAGSVAVMARYDVFVGVFNAIIPLGQKIPSLPTPANFIDEKVFARLQKLGMPPSPQADDATLLRRVTIDIAGRLPTLEETKAYLADTDAARYEKLVDRLLASEDYAYYFANKWSAVLRNRRKTGNEDPKPSIAFHAWIKDGLNTNKPYDRFVRDLVTAEGRSDTSPNLVWYREVNTVHDQVEDVAQLFLGQRLICARCHHHPLEKWSQNDYYSLAAFFSRLEVKIPQPPKPDNKNKMPPPILAIEVSHKMGSATAENPKTKTAMEPAALDGPRVQIAPETDPRLQLVDWMTKPDNPFFARTLVNRYWKHFFGRGLIDPEDDMRVSNPPSNPELLDALAAHFIKNQFDLKNLVRTIVTSRTYRISSEPNEYNQMDRQNFSRFVSRRLPAEVLLDAIDDVTGSRTGFGGMPAGTRAVWLPDNQVNSYFLNVFGRPDSSSACECERSSESNLAQALHLVNSPDLVNKITKGRLPRLAADKRPHAEKLRDFYLMAFSREPTADEQKILQAHLDHHADSLPAAYEDIFWSVLNSKEFFFNH